MTSFRRLSIVLALILLFWLLPSSTNGQKGGRGLRPPPRRPANSPRSPLYPKGQGRLGTSVKVLSSLGASESLRRSAQSLDGYQNQKAVLEGLRSQGLDRSDNAVYSIFFKTTGGIWSDWLSKPDIFFYVDIEGQGSFLVPQIHWNYGDGPVLDSVLARDVKPGTKIVVRVLDDDTWSDEIWNNILKTRLSIYVSPEIQATKYISIKSGYVGGQIQLLDRNLVIDAPDPIATAEFVVPEAKDGIWMANGTLYDEGGKDVGNIQFACVWRAKTEWQENLGIASGWFGWAVFWLVLGLCFLVWFLRQVFTRATPVASQ